MIRHMLAWLSFNGKVHYAVAAKTWRVGSEPAWVEDQSSDLATAAIVETNDDF
jgi:hypothetical protein